MSVNAAGPGSLSSPTIISTTATLPPAFIACRQFSRTWTQLSSSQSCRICFKRYRSAEGTDWKKSPPSTSVRSVRPFRAVSAMAPSTMFGRSNTIPRRLGLASSRRCNSEPFAPPMSTASRAVIVNTDESHRPWNTKDWGSYPRCVMCARASGVPTTTQRLSDSCGKIIPHRMHTHHRTCPVVRHGRHARCGSRHRHDEPRRRWGYTTNRARDSVLQLEDSNPIRANVIPGLCGDQLNSPITSGESSASRRDTSADPQGPPKKPHAAPRNGPARPISFGHDRSASRPHVLCSPCAKGRVRNETGA